MKLGLHLVGYIDFYNDDDCSENFSVVYQDEMVLPVFFSKEKTALWYSSKPVYYVIGSDIYGEPYEYVVDDLVFSAQIFKSRSPFVKEGGNVIFFAKNGYPVDGIFKTSEGKIDYDLSRLNLTFFFKHRWSRFKRKFKKYWR